MAALSSSTSLLTLIPPTTIAFPVPTPTPIPGVQTVTLTSTLCADRFTSCSSTSQLLWLNTPLNLNTSVSQLVLTSAEGIDLDLVKCQVFYAGGDAGPIVTVDAPISSSFGTVEIGEVTCSVSDASKGQDQGGQVRPEDTTSNGTTTTTAPSDGSATDVPTDWSKGKDQGGQIRPGDDTTTTTWVNDQGSTTTSTAAVGIPSDWVDDEGFTTGTTATATGVVPTTTGVNGGAVGGGNSTVTGTTPPAATFTGGANSLRMLEGLALLAAAASGLAWL